MPPIPYRTYVRGHPGSSQKEIDNEPDWSSAKHHIGYRDRFDRVPGLVQSGDDSDSEDSQDSFLKEAAEESDELQKDLKQHKLVNFREAKEKQEDYYLEEPEDHPNGWRYRLNESEDFIKNQEPCPANLKRHKQKEEKEKEEKEKKEQEEKQEQEHEWKDGNLNRQRHNDAYASSGGQDDSKATNQDGDKQDGKNDQKDLKDGSQADQADSEEQKDSKPKSGYEKLREKYSVQEIALLRSLQAEKKIVENLKQSDGKMKSPWAHLKPSDVIDDADRASPDNWIPRDSNMIRLTGKHPLNAEYPLSDLFETGLITPNRLHCVRNHGPVPHLLWETHELDIENGKCKFSMDDLKNRFESVNIAVALACDEIKSFNWGAGAISNAFWKGAFLSDVLKAAGIDYPTNGSGVRRWVNFAGSDEPSEGTYETCIPYEYAMDPVNDVLLAYEMNDVKLPPDHGYPLRVIIPGYVGGRQVKWLKKIWISEKENDSHYHIWDNRVLPAFVTEKDGEFSETLFRHPDTACNEQNLNSVIANPGHGERIGVSDVKKGHTYRIAGYAYDGGGHEVQRVEVSLDNGETWLYCIRQFPEAPIRHGQKYWTWIHWYIDIEQAHLLRAPSIIVRCFNVFKNTQPEFGSWNVMGMMNNGWYKVKPEITESKDGNVEVLFCHPVEPGTGTGGWVEPSADEKIASAKHSSNTPQKQFTREEIEKHDKEDDCWIVVDGNVYDATSVLDWHPGGKATIMNHGGKLSQETSESFESIHDGYAYKKLAECILGTVTDKAKAHMKKEAEAAAKAKAEASNKKTNVVLSMQQWYPVTLQKKKNNSEDTRQYTFSLGDKSKKLGLGTCQHLQMGFHMADKMLVRSYTPTAPIVGADTEDGTFDLVVKTYFPTDDQPGGALSNILDCMKEGEEVEIRGPTGDIKYLGDGKFEIFDEEQQFENITLILGGSGITPGYQLIARIMATDSDKTKIKVVDANKDESAILLREDLNKFAKDHKDSFEIQHILSHPSDDWKGEKGHVDADKIKKYSYGPEKESGKKSVVFVCGPPAMIQKAAMPALRDWGYEEGKDMFGF
ncbi:uncharacterized protein M437DRAFT_79565 [Aureobasidium melanogenum CBS 110374]|uniref:Nitrate reductase [NADPH] n=3 Tax=Aureobasidium melanogenum TaxID=46634 RepID=A0A074W4Y5_AURM1|nr:uncharacterized protein M437DRAFT_79565 [Aureobasidium melanogenum CBS 110374]KEQ57611.1 hypothetical protein M437DRAFT_79565 [Aureobasidium melanogenum CBS 110374]